MAVIDERDPDGRRKLNQGFGAALSNAFEIAMIPPIFGAAGSLVDRMVGTGWIFAAILGVIGLVGTFVKLYYRYSYDMQQLEASGSWHRPSQDVL